MPGKQALKHIRKTDGFSPSEANKQLQSAISHGAVRVRLYDPEDPSRNTFPRWEAGPDGQPVLVPGFKLFPSRKQWGNARFRANGTVQFFPTGNNSHWYKFEALLADVLRIWPASSAPSQVSAPRKKGGAITFGITEAIKDLWGSAGRIPKGLGAKERNNKILEWLDKKKYSKPKNEGLARAVQRVIKPRA
jgi:hypothetical protein